MEMAQLWAWMETLLRNMGMWDTMTSALTIIVIVSLGMFGLSVLRR